MIPEYWWPYLYQYGVGGLIFVIGLFLILKYKSCVLSRSQDRLWFAVLLIGFVWYAGVHFAWYELSLRVLPPPEVVGAAQPMAAAAQPMAGATQPASAEQDQAQPQATTQPAADPDEPAGPGGAR